jgi:predicted glycogen debranching enzyme
MRRAPFAIALNRENSRNPPGGRAPLSHARNPYRGQPATPLEFRLAPRPALAFAAPPRAGTIPGQEAAIPTPTPPDAEWLQPDARGGFASGTAGLIRTRRYHALLLTSTTPPTGRLVLVNGIEAWLEHPAFTAPLSRQLYTPNVTTPATPPAIAAFTAEPWPLWRFTLPNGADLTQEILVDPISGDTILRWRTTESAATLHVRPLLSVRDYHALHSENPDFDFTPAITGGNVAWRPYASRPAVACLTNGAYRHDPTWYRRFLYTAERDRGLDCTEDLAAPGIFSFRLADGDAIMVLRPGDGLALRPGPHAARIFAAETTRRAAIPGRLARSAEAYLADRGAGSTLIAGFPWFTDWGRDTFIALRGLLLGTGRIAEATAVLLAWAGHVSDGMLPNRFPDGGETPDYNTADASLWFVIAAHALLAQPGITAAAQTSLREAVDAILDGHTRGTRFGIAMDTDGLLRAGVPGQQLTWMDAKIGDWVVTPRIGKPVEIQALWINALRIAAAWNPTRAALAERATASVRARFPNQANGGLFDVVDANHIPGATDAAIRPNQIFALGGLPFPLLDGPQAAAILALVERELLTPLGLRTLSPADPAYQPHYRGTPLQRDSAYHQGTAWPWLTGPFVEAWLRVHGDTPDNRATARARFVAPLLAHLDVAGLGHVSEVADGDAPHTPGGCPFQAWSLGELIRAVAMTA